MIVRIEFAYYHIFQVETVCSEIWSSTLVDPVESVRTFGNSFPRVGDDHTKLEMNKPAACPCQEITFIENV